MRRLLAVFLGLSFLNGCIPHKKSAAALPPPTVPIAIKKIYVQPLQGAGGAEVTNEFVRRFLGLGFTVSENAKDADAVVSGLITDYKPARAISVFLGSAKVSVGDQTMDVSYPVLSLGDAAGTPEAISLAAQIPQIVAIETSLSVAAQVNEEKSGRLLWEGEAGYEALDLNGALTPTMDLLMTSIKQTLSSASKAKVNG